MHHQRLGSAWLASVLAACGGGGLEDGRHATGSTTVLANQSYDALYAANVDQGTLSKARASDLSVSEELVVGMEPTRLARVGTRVLVTLRGERGLAEVDDGPGGMRLVRVVSLGTEPFGIVSREDGARVYVALSTESKVVELDGESLEVRRSWGVGGEPRWLALHPSGDALYAGAAFGGFITWIDLREDDETLALALPPILMPAPDHAGKSDIFFGGEVQDGGDRPLIPLRPRVTGDPAVSPAGDTLYIPALYVDTMTPVPPPNTDPFAGADGCGYDCASADGESRGARFNPIVVEVPVDSSGEPAMDEALPVDVATPSPGAFATVRSYPASVTVAPDGDTVVVTFEGSNAVVAYDAVTDDEYDPFAGIARGGIAELTQSGITVRERVLASTGAGPRGGAFLSGAQLVVHSFLDYQLERLDMTRARELMAADDELLDGVGASFDPATGAVLSFTTESRVRVTSGVLPQGLEDGRRLFYSAADSRMAALGAGVSCATCHFDGRNDGLTWPLTLDGRQTPSLAGQVSRTAPVTWSDNVATVLDEVLLTSQGRMGGQGLEPAVAENIAAFIDSQRHADVPLRGVVDPEIDLGREIFFRSDVGCAECHAGELYTDNQSHELVGTGRTQTPTLLGVAVTAPYFHDGRSPTLRDVLERSRGGTMGNTSMLSDAEMRALEKYLRSL